MKITTSFFNSLRYFFLIIAILHRAGSLNPVSAVCELSFVVRNKVYSFSLVSPLPNFRHGVLSEDGNGKWQESSIGGIRNFIPVMQLIWRFKSSDFRDRHCDCCGIRVPHCGQIQSSEIFLDDSKLGFLDQATSQNTGIPFMCCVSLVSDVTLKG
ncbi:hypothetical protein SADUNF_Sadunf07G0048100 [Salix dunnii]|uniref:Secreted protein n=1 Tax=Salix dunnii TaxID=1413687 RepID=A0A835JZY5_9ROSI|nr:hypothetical protein SADUNF_Sadunf07G0048100 [Salix dunnii]